MIGAMLARSDAPVKEFHLGTVRLTVGWERFVVPEVRAALPGIIAIINYARGHYDHRLSRCSST